MPKFPTQIDTLKISVKSLIAESSGTAPTSPVVGQQWTDTSVTPKVVKVWDGSIWAPLNVYAGTTAGTYTAGNDSRITGALQSANNLSDLGSATTARTNLGLGGAATLNVGTGAGTVAAGNDSRIVGAEQTSNKGAASGYASLDAGTKVPIAQIPTGSTGTTVALGNDSRLSDQRVPTDASVTGGPAGSGVKIAAATITTDNLAAALKDGAAGVSTTRQLGTGSTQAFPGNGTLNQLSAPTASFDMNGQRITGIGAPVSAGDAVRLSDLQTAQAGIDAKPSVRAASTANVTVASGLINGSTMDGVTLATGDRVLLKNQSTASENGVYIVAASGAASRATDTLTPNSTWFVEEGTAAGDTAWWITNNGAITPGSTSLVISQFSGGTSYVGTTNRITVTGTAIDIAATYVGQTSITTLGTIGSGTWQGTAVAVLYGGTGATTAAGARTNLGVAQKGYAADLGAITAGGNTVVTHGLGTQDVTVSVRLTANQEIVYPTVIATSTTQVTVYSDVAYNAADLRIVVIPAV